MIAHAVTDPGLARENNEDAYCLMQNKAGNYLAAVCDGIGGRNAGEVASRICCRTLETMFAAAKPFEKDWEVSNFIQEALNKANDLIYKESLNKRSEKGMGTTCVGAVICPNGTYIFNAGDSRLYAKYPDGLVQMSEDHSVTAKLLREGKITYEEAKNHVQKNTLINAVGIWRVFRIDINKIQDTYSSLLICSDGLSDYVSRQDIEDVMDKETLSCKEKAELLVDMANDNGGQDNCTVIVMDRGGQFKERS